MSRRFPRRSPPSLLTTAARGGLEPVPDRRLRGAVPHLSHSSTPPLLLVCSWHTMRIAVLRHHRIDYHAITDQPLFDDPRRHRRRGHAASWQLCSPLFAFGRHHEVLGGLDIQPLADVIANDNDCLPASLARALLRRAGNHALHAADLGGQFLPSRMPTAPVALRRSRQRFALALRPDLDVAYPPVPVPAVPVAQR